MSFEIEEVTFVRAGSRIKGFARASETCRIVAGGFRGMQGVHIETSSGKVFVPETNVVEIHYAELTEPVPTIQETKQRGSSRGRNRAT